MLRRRAGRRATGSPLAEEDAPMVQQAFPDAGVRPGVGAIGRFVARRSLGYSLSMRHRRNRLRVFALVWAVLQFALPTFATAADARLAVGSADKAHVEEGPGTNCAPSHSPDCAVCKHLSTTSLSATQVHATCVSDGNEGIVPGRVAEAARTPDGVALPRAPPTRL
jgi:hypothetical protein